MVQLFPAGTHLSHLHELETERTNQVTMPQSASRSETFSELFDQICANIQLAVRGKNEVIRLMVLCLVAEGHLLIEDAPGVGKTSLAKALAASIEGTLGRIQFTPDLLPGDVTGISVWNRSTGDFDFRPGPVFNNIVLGDEINRASPKTQSALLESMAEKQVTVDGSTRQLSTPFMVIATQNPVEHEGTYVLPEAQLDRFLMRVSVGYPDREAEIDILTTLESGDVTANLKPVVTAENVRAMAKAVNAVHVAPSLRNYMVDLAAATRSHPSLALGMSPRAVLALQRITRTAAAAAQRDHVIPDDLKTMAEPTLAHRLMLTPEAQLQGVSAAQILKEIVAALPVPTGPGLV